jgi:protein-disulfide isomerase
VEFSDYECPFCAHQATEVLPLLDADYVVTGKVQYVFMNFPLPKHQLAPMAGQAAACAGEQNKYWPMHDRLFHSSGLQHQNLLQHASVLSLDVGSFSQCLNSGRYGEYIARDYLQGLEMGLFATPTTFIGTTSDHDTVAAHAEFDGTVPYRSLRRAIDAALESLLQSRKTSPSSGRK